MTRKLLRTDWMNIVSRLSIDEAGECFSEEMMRVTKMCMPVKQITVRQHDTPWITQIIKKLIKKKNRIHRLAKTSDSAHVAAVSSDS